MRIILFNMLCLLFFGYGYSQIDTSDRDVKIDPRQYVTVQYKKTPTQGKLDTLWNWENRINVPNQKIIFIDVDGEIKIDFSKVELINNKDFEGTVSLEAEISGVNGTRKIEVNPYSEIGVQRIPIGIKSDPPTEITKKLLNMISELKDAASAYDFNSIYGSFTKKDIIRRKEIMSKKKFIDSLVSDPKVTIQQIIPEAIELRQFCRNEFNIYFFDALSEYPRKIDSTFKNSKNKNELQKNIEVMYKIYNDQYEDDRDNYILRFKNALSYTINKIDVTLSYLNSFENSGEDAMKALLSLINKDLINYNSLKSGLIASRTQITKIDPANLTADTLAIFMLEKADEINDATGSLAKYTRFKGSVLEKEIMSIANRDNLVYNKTDTNSYVREKLLQDFYFTVIENYLQELSQKLSIDAGRIIYKKLVYAIIDLGKSGAKNGEVLNVYLTWILDSKRDSLANSPRLPIGKYYLRETGWRMQISDMFALVKRIHESSVDQTKVSPSNFKGSGGAVLMWTFNKEDKGMTIKQISDNSFAVKKKNRFVNFLEPSIGLNVSYLDFSTDKDVEIGTGLQVGLFRNKIFFGYGINLHMLSPKNQSPSYYYVGFSFAKLSELFKDSHSVASVPE